MSDPNLNLGVGGGAPNPLGGPPGPSLEDDEKALKKGNTGILIGGAVAAVLVVVVLVVVLMQGGGGDEYGAIGQQINGMKSEYFDGFWACALPGEQIADLRSDQDLRYAITKRAQSNPRRYGTHVREQCLVKLNEHEPGLRQLIAPEDLQEQLGALTTSLNDLRTGWNDYIASLEREETYDEDAHRDQINTIAKGWYDYKRAHGALNDAIREHVQ